MIVTCEKCGSKFNFTDDLLKPDGSKVRCSVCREIFTVFPPPPEDPAPDGPGDGVPPVEGEREETVILDSPPDFGDEAGEPFPDTPSAESSEADLDADFDLAFEEAVAEKPSEMSATEELDLSREEISDDHMIEAIDRAEQIEQTVRMEDAQQRGVEEMRSDDKTIVLGDSDEPRPRRSWFLPIVLVVFLLLGGAVAVFFLTPQWIPDFLSFLKPVDKQSVADVGVRRLSFKEVKGSFEDAAKSGQVFIIKGLVANNYKMARNHILVKGSILDAQGKIVKSKLAYAGNTISKKQLMTLTPEQMNKIFKNRTGRGNNNVNIKPGSAVPFMIVFAGLPEDVSEFTVEAVSSSAGR